MVRGQALHEEILHGQGIVGKRTQLERLRRLARQCGRHYLDFLSKHHANELMQVLAASDGLVVDEGEAGQRQAWERLKQGADAVVGRITVCEGPEPRVHLSWCLSGESPWHVLSAPREAVYAPQLLKLWLEVKAVSQMVGAESACPS